ncbi:aquaporin family protein [Acidiphilium sp. PA]|uniref:MIP/aquaporin family protein n=1 Tax=Acidiphilium sp. PA TaxID=2871705 RepID=UPI0022444F48|nr:MIP/aquaporin family protein [Acidiphilium sp. PA]MCW8305414.1 aquaporin family protein [Acidiphilium sp. PA]
MSNTSEYTSQVITPSRSPARMGVKSGWRATSIYAEMIAEFLGCIVLIAFGAGVVAVAVVGLTESGRTAVIFNGAGGWLLITWGWAFAVTLAVYVAGGVTGAHLNPAVSLAFAVKGDFPWRKVLPYWVAQIAGCFVGAALVYADYFRAIDAWNAAHHVASYAAKGGLTTFSIFATFPASYLGAHMGLALLDQIIGTFFLLLFILAISDNLNLSPQSNMGPFLVGIAVAAIGMSYGVDAGYAINPARDFGPRLFTWVAGWGPNAFPGPHGYWWVPVLGPMIGAVLAVYVYKWAIGLTLVARNELLKSEHPMPPQEGIGYSLEQLQAALDKAKKAHAPSLN